MHFPLFLCLYESFWKGFESDQRRLTQTVHSPLFFRKIIEIERFELRAAILHECQNYLWGGGGLGGSEKNRGTSIFLHPPPPPPAIIPDARPLGTFENQDSRDGKTR